MRNYEWRRLHGRGFAYLVIPFLVKTSSQFMQRFWRYLNVLNKNLVVTKGISLFIAVKDSHGFKSSVWPLYTTVIKVRPVHICKTVIADLSVTCFTFSRVNVSSIVCVHTAARRHNGDPGGGATYIRHRVQNRPTDWRRLCRKRRRTSAWSDLSFARLLLLCTLAVLTFYFSLCYCEYVKKTLPIYAAKVFMVLRFFLLNSWTVEINMTF